MRKIQHGLLLAQLGWAKKFMNTCNSMPLEFMDSTVEVACDSCNFTTAMKIAPHDEGTHLLIRTEFD